MVITNLSGGLGNQMFQYAAGKALAIRLSTNVKVNTSYLKNDPLRSYAMHFFSCTIQEVKPNELKKIKYASLPLLKQLKNTLLMKRKPQSTNVFNEESYSYNKNFESLKDNTYLIGYWQSPKYFEQYRDIILQEFTPGISLSEKCNIFEKKILNSQSVSLHIRRGDYVHNTTTNKIHGTCSLNYYKKAISLIQEKNPTSQFYIFSDDLQWCRKQFSFLDKVIFVEDANTVHDFEEIYLMSKCKHNIIANSSFSWWGAWLNKNPNKMVIAPKQWFKDTDIDTSDLIPDNWIKI